MKPNGAIQPREIIGWFRSKAKEFNAMADSLESTFANVAVNGSEHKAQGFTLNIPASFERVKEAVQKSKSLRAAQIADDLGSTRESVLEIVKNNPEHFEVVGKGWIKIKE